MERLRVKEAIAHAGDCGRKTSRIEIARMLWPNRNESAQRHNMCNLESGRTTRVEVGWIRQLSDYFGCTADMLVGNEPFPNIHAEAK